MVRATVLVRSMLTVVLAASMCALWSPAVHAAITDLGASGLDVGDFNPSAVNASETVVGTKVISTDCGGPTGHAARWTRAGGLVDIGNLGTAASDISSAASDINDAGRIVGSSHTIAGCAGIRPFTSENGAALVDIGVPAGATNGDGVALGVNNIGDVVGFSVAPLPGSACDTTGTSFEFVPDDCPQATRWAGGVAGTGAFSNMALAPDNVWHIRSVATLGAMVGYKLTGGTATGQFWPSSFAAPIALSLVPREHGISPDGTLIVGSSVGQPYVATVAAGVPGPRVALQLPAGATGGAAFAVNDRAQIVGEVATPLGAWAVMWAGPSAEPQLLDSFLPAGSGWVVRRAFDISAGGAIVGTGTHNGASHAYIMDGAIEVDDVGDAPNAVPGSQTCATATTTCTLRAAIETANARTGAQTITFRIAGAGVPTIHVASALPATSGKLTINGSTQSAGSVTVDGGGGAYDGLRLTAGSSEIAGLKIQHFGGAGVVVSGASDNDIGGDTAAKAVTITANEGPGLQVLSGSGNAVSPESLIYGNADPDIDLGPSGAVNHAAGTAAGPNHALNAPVVWRTPAGLGYTGVMGRLDGVPNSRYRIDILLNACGSALPSAVERVSTYRDTPESGYVNFQAGASASPSGSTAMARATRLTAAGVPIETSQYSNCGWDRDNDRILDPWETSGADVLREGTHLVDLPAMGASPLHADLFLQINWMQGHQISDEAIRDIEAAFADAPTAVNPDGTTGINLHIDGGPATTMNLGTARKWGSLSKAVEVPTSPVIGRDSGTSYDWGQFDVIKRRSFDRRRIPTFHFALSAIKIGTKGFPLGMARDIPSSDFIMGMKATCAPGIDCAGTRIQQAGTTMHEFGHTLGLMHGGNEHANTKPNYLSIMNYSFAYAGLVTSGNGTSRTAGVLDYSRYGQESLGDLDPTWLDETKGFDVTNAAVKKFVTTFTCFRKVNGKSKVWNQAHWMSIRAVDFNCNGRATDTHTYGAINLNAPTVAGYTMKPFNDWPALQLVAGHMSGDDDVFMTPATRAHQRAAISLEARTDNWPSRATLQRYAGALVGDATAPRVNIQIVRKRGGAVVVIRARDSRALDSVTIQVDKQAPRTFRAREGSRRLTAKLVLKLARGRHTIRVMSVDSIGNTSRVIARRFKR